MRVAAMSLAVAVISVSSADRVAAQAPDRPFDGTWKVLVTCSAASDGSQGYVFRFPATVANGVLRGLYGVRDTPSSMDLEGTISQDGNSLLFAHGQTGNPIHAYKQVTSGHPFKYHVQTHFTATHGEGNRLELRACTFTFDRG